MQRRLLPAVSIAAVFLLLWGCAEPADPVATGPAAAASGNARAAAARHAGAGQPQRRPYFGDLHVHSSLSLDAYIVFARNSPRDVFRFARGLPVELYGGHTKQLAAPLDFVALTEHAEFLGELFICRDKTSAEYGSPVCHDIRNEAEDRAIENKVYRNVMLPLISRAKPVRLGLCGDGGEKCLAAGRTAWQEMQELSEEFYEPGVFTTFVGFEWSSEYLGNQHRNVIFRNAHVPPAAWSAVEYPYPEDLWHKLNDSCTEPCEAITISHNSNQSKGLRFASSNPDGSPLTGEQAALRLRYEPLVEITQVKGQSECRAGLGTVDEDCNFELFDLRPVCAPGSDGGSCVTPCEANPGAANCVWGRNYVRNALKAGLELGQRLGVNPFKTGFIGSTDTHNSNPGDTAEDAYIGSFGVLESDPEERRLLRLPTGYPELSRNPGGLAGVWAEENTRDSLFDALKRRETFATSGTRILLRFFGGWQLPATLHDDADLVALGYGNGVPMGGDLPPAVGAAPRFIVWAMQDANSATLYKAQIIKGWRDANGNKERVYDIACGAGRAPDPLTARCPATTATVDLSDCSVSDGPGASQLQAIWSDPDFDPRQPAFYYLRVLENPTCRWSTWDAIRSGRPPPPEAPAVINERAWSSPIWYAPL